MHSIPSKLNKRGKFLRFFDLWYNANVHIFSLHQQKQLLKDALGWGIFLWLIGYVLGILLFAFVPSDLLGWIIMPIGTIITILVLLKKIKVHSLRYYFLLAIVWTLIAIVFDYFFLVQVFKPADGYYKPDVYVYYALTCILPLVVGWSKSRKNNA